VEAGFPKGSCSSKIQLRKSAQYRAIALLGEPLYMSGAFIVAHAQRFIRALRLAVQDIALSRR
jgi:hypothetical protein